MTDPLAELDAKLAAVGSFCERLGHGVQLQIELPDDDVDHANRLDAQGRPFFEVTSQLVDAVATGMRLCLEDVYTAGEGNASVAEVFAAGAEAARSHFVARFVEQGSDVTLAPLTPLYRAWKGRRGYSTLIGIKTGHLLGSLKRARITFV